MFHRWTESFVTPGCLATTSTEAHGSVVIGYAPVRSRPCAPGKGRRAKLCEQDQNAGIGTITLVTESGLSLVAWEPFFRIRPLLAARLLEAERSRCIPWETEVAACAQLVCTG